MAVLLKIMFTKRPTYCLTNNSVESLKVNLIKRKLDNRIYESNYRNADFDDLPFDGEKGCIAI